MPSEVRTGSGEKATSSMRSALMARIRGRNTTPEMILRRALWAEGMRYRLQPRLLGVRPDLAFIGPRVAVFIDGCFWHGCPQHYVRPRSNPGFWSKKLRGNVERDRHQTNRLRSAGWRVLRFWEHAIHEELQGVVREIESAVREVEVSEPASEWRVLNVTVLDEDTDLERRTLGDLTNPRLIRVVEQVRNTAKWKVAVPVSG